MATTQAQAEQTERKLRPLYDAVDNGHNKKAIQIADKILKKQGDLHCAKTLKAIALLRIGRHDESNVLISEVKETHPGDQATLQACTMYFREIGDFKKIAELYADAAKHYPKNQEILTHLFMAYVRIGDYQRQQQTAALLHKNFPPSGPYYCWRVMSILMQAHESKQVEVVQNMYLPLAEKLMDKYFLDNDVDAEAEVRLYLMVLDKTHNVEKKLEVLCGAVGDRLKSTDERNDMIVDCLVGLGRLDEAAKKLAEMIIAKPDQWSYIKTYIKCQIQRCQNFRERVRQQVARDRESRQEEEEEEEGEESEGKGDAVESSEGGKRKENGSTEKKEDSHQRAGEQKELKVKEGGTEVSATDVAVTTSGGDGEGRDENASKAGEGGGEEEGRAEDSTEESNEVVVRMEDILQPLTEARDLMERLADEEQKKNYERPPGAHVMRGPLLARMEVAKQVILFGMQDMNLQLAHPREMLLDYLSIFGDKSCVFDDLRMYLDVFPEEEVGVVLQHLEEVVTNDPVNFDCEDSELKENIGRLRRHTNLVQLQRYKGYHLDLDAQGKQALVDVCRHYYQQGLKLSRNQVQTLNKACDFYIILATHLKVELYQETDDVSHLWEAVFMLEYARSRGTNHQFMILLMKLYGHLGATECITVLFQALNIKHLQMDTLGYIPIRYMQSMGTFEYSAQLYRSVLRFFFGASKEISEYIIQAYRNGMFHKIVEFVNLRERLAHSMNFSSVMVDMNYMELIVSVNKFPEAKAFFSREWYQSSPFTSPNLRDYCARLLDSRDLKVFEDWDPSHQRLNDIETKISFDFECLWIRVRISLLRCLREGQLLAERGRKETSTTPTPAAPTGGGGRGQGAGSEQQGSKGSKETNSVDRLTAYSERLEEFIKTLELLNQHVGTRMLRQQRSRTLLPIQSPPPCLGFTFHQEQHGNVLKRMLMVLEQVAKGATSIEDRLKDILKHVETAKSRITIVPEELREALRKISTREEGDQISIDGLQHPFDIMTKTKMDLERYVMFIQTISNLLLLCMFCVEYLSPSSAGEGKKKRRKNKKIEQPVVLTELKGFVQELKSHLQTLYHQFSPLPIPPADDEQLREKLNRLYIGASSVKKATSTNGGRSGDDPSSMTGLATQEAAAYPSCSATSQAKGSTEGEAAVTKAVPNSTGVTINNITSAVATNDMHFERSVVSKVMGQVLESYNMSFKDVLKVVVTKMDMIDALVKQLGGVDP